MLEDVAVLPTVKIIAVPGLMVPAFVKRGAVSTAVLLRAELTRGEARRELATWLRPAELVVVAKAYGHAGGHYPTVPLPDDELPQRPVPACLDGLPTMRSYYALPTPRRTAVQG